MCRLNLGFRRGLVRDISEDGPSLSAGASARSRVRMLALRSPTDSTFETVATSSGRTPRRSGEDNATLRNSVEQSAPLRNGVRRRTSPSRNGIEIKGYGS